MHECEISNDAAAEHADARSQGGTCEYCCEEFPGPRPTVRTLSVSTHPETTAGGGARETWLGGGGGDPDKPGSFLFRVDAMGDTHLALLVEINRGADEAPTRLWEYVDMSTLVNDWVTAVTEQHEAEEKQLAALDDFADEEPFEDGTPEAEHTDTVTERAIQADEDGAL